MKIELIATATFGLEAVVKREVEALGYKIIKSEDGKITFLGDERALVRANLWLRTADRVLVKMAEFEAREFEELFQQTKGIPWEEWIPVDGNAIVTGSSVRSQLHSVPACQSIVKKAIMERLKDVYGLEKFPETGAEYTVKVAILKDRVTLTMDSSGVGLHKRGYRVVDAAAPIKETLASAIVQLSFWKEGRLLVDPCCGSGTIAIEAAMIGRNIAPGLNRNFVSETWHVIPRKIWQEEKKAAFDAINHEADVRIEASDISPAAIKAAMENAAEAGVDDCIHFEVLDIENLAAREKQGIIVTNPPYGERIGEEKDIDKIYKSLAKFFKINDTWSLFLITTDKDFEFKVFGHSADRRRKLYNGRLETCLYQFHGAKPPREPREK